MVAFYDLNLIQVKYNKAATQQPTTVNSFTGVKSIHENLIKVTSVCHFILKFDLLGHGNTV